MLKIYNPGKHICDDLQGCYYKNFLPFDIEKNDWAHVSDIRDAQIIAIHGHDIYDQSKLYNKIEQIKALNLHPDQKLLFMNIYHLDHGFTDRMSFLFLRKIVQQEIPNEFAIVHTNFALDMEIKYDFLFNREKIYFTDYNSIELDNRLYVLHGNIRNFALSAIEKDASAFGAGMKKFLAPNRIYNFEHIRFKYRRKLADFIKEYTMDGYWSDPFNNIIMYSENPETDHKLKEGGWYPIANRYYKNTYFSMFTETVTGKVTDDYPYRSITEKTWDPLIKGHFILPFGYHGLIDHVKSYGFKFPNWIDYSYDQIEDDDLRFDAFLDSAEKLLDLSLDELHDLYLKDRDILVHNREQFWKLPYDSLHDKVVDFFQIGK